MATATLADIPALPVVDIPGVVLCREGTWNGHLYTRADLQQVAENWQQLKGTFDTPLTLGHDGESALGDGEPAYGWVGNVHVDGDALVGDYLKVPGKLAQLIKAGAYAKRSCTFLEGAVIDGQKRGLVLQNVALLGAQTPAVDGLDDIAALYNRRRLKAEGGNTLTLASDDKPFKTVDGTKFHVSDFAYTPDDSDPGTWSLRIHATPGGKADAGLVGAACAAMGKGFRGNKVSMPTADRDAVKSRLRGAWREANPDKSDDDMPDVLQNARTGGESVEELLRSLARLPDAERQAYASWKQAHPRMYQLIAGPPLDDIQSAVEEALQKQYPPAMSDDGDDTPGADGPSCNILDWYVSGQKMSVIVSDQDIDNLFEVPFTYDAGTDTAMLQAPIPVKGTYVANDSGQESGDMPGSDATSDEETNPAHEDATAPATDGGGTDTTAAAPADEATQQMARRLEAALTTISLRAPADPVDAIRVRVESGIERVEQLAKAAPVDSDVERLIDELSSDLDDCVSKLNSIAAGKSGVTQLRALIKAAQGGLAKFKVAKPPAASGSGDGPTPKAQQNARQTEEGTDVKLAELALKLGLPATATQAEIDSALDGAVATRGVVQTLARKVDQLIERDTQADIDRKLARAVEEGRLKRWSKPGEDGELYTTIRTLARTDMKTAESIIASLPPYVDAGEYGRMGNDDGMPQQAVEFKPGVARELRKLGRDPASITDRRPLGDRWRDFRAKQEADRAAKWGIPNRGDLSA